jgi:hypothetical protein
MDQAPGRRHTSLIRVDAVEVIAGDDLSISMVYGSISGRNFLSPHRQSWQTQTYSEWLDWFEEEYQIKLGEGSIVSLCQRNEAQETCVLQHRIRMDWQEGAQQWSQANVRMAKSEGWGLFHSFGETTELRIERLDEIGGLQDDIQAWRLVMQGTSMTHVQARSLIRRYSPGEWQRMNEQVV